MNYAVLLSGGVGTRTGADIPKQYVKVAGYMMATYALRPLLECERIDQVCIVADESWREELIADVKNAGLDTSKIIGFANPGETRQLSVLNGMKAIIEAKGEVDEEDSALIHDAARPCLTVELLNRCYDALSGHDGVMPVLPMKDTVYYSETGTSIGKLLEREKIFAGQAPELFAFVKYFDANRALFPDEIKKINGASEPAVMAGMDIVMIDGDENNVKVTTETDLKKFMSSFEK